jgi:hypothetical protein
MGMFSVSGSVAENVGSSAEREDGKASIFAFSFSTTSTGMGSVGENVGEDVGSPARWEDGGAMVFSFGATSMVIV